MDLKVSKNLKVLLISSYLIILFSLHKSSTLYKTLPVFSFNFLFLTKYKIYVCAYILCLSSTVYRKPTHTDLYLQWDSHHTLPSKYSVIGTLLHRAKTICSNPKMLKQEEDHLYRALTKCKYPAQALNRIRIKSRS